MRRFLITISIILLGSTVFAQYNQFSQYFATSILINPAFAGTSPQKSFSTNYKRSGQANDGTFNEMIQGTIAIPLLLTTTKTIQTGGVALTFNSQNRGFGGILKTQKVLATGAYSLRLDRLRPTYLIFGMQSGVVFDKIDSDNLRWGSQYNRYIGFDNTLRGEAIDGNLNTYPVFNFGIVYAAYNHDNIYIRDKSLMVGLSIDNLNRPRTSSFAFSNGRHTILVKLLAVGEIELTPKSSIHPTFLSLYKQGSYQVNVGAYWSRLISPSTAKTGVILQAGGWYRVNDSAIALIGLQIERIRTGVSYDFNSDIFSENIVINQTGNSFEVSVTYDLGVRKNLNKIVNPLF